MKRITALIVSLLLLCGYGIRCTVPSDETAYAHPSLVESAVQTLDSEQLSEHTPTAFIETEDTEPIPSSPVFLDIPAGAYPDVFWDDELNVRLDYWYFIPEDAVVGMPLLMYLHGDGNVGFPESLPDSGLISFVKEIYGDHFPFIVLQPCASRYSWIDGNIPQALIRIIELTANKCAIDCDHIILTGHSRGAIGTWSLLTQYGSYFSAAVPVSCGNQTNLDYDVCSQVPVWAFAGNIGADELGYNATMQYIVKSIQDHGGIAVMTTLEGYSHGMTPSGAYSKETIEWMLSQ